MSAFLAEMRSPAGPQRPAGPRNRKGSLGNEPLPIAHCTNGGSVGAVCLSASKSRRSSANVKFDNVGREKSHKAATERVRRTQRSSDPSPPGGSQSRRSSALRPRPTTSGLGNLRPQRPARTKSPARLRHLFGRLRSESGRSCPGRHPRSRRRCRPWRCPEDLASPGPATSRAARRPAPAPTPSSSGAPAWMPSAPFRHPPRCARSSPAGRRTSGRGS